MGAKPLKVFPYFHANESHFRKRGLTLGSILKVRVFGTRKWSLFCLRSTNAKDVTICLVQSSYDFTRRAKFKTTWVCKNIFAYCIKNNLPPWIKKTLHYTVTTPETRSEPTVVAAFPQLSIIGTCWIKFVVLTTVLRACFDHRSSVQIPLAAIQPHR